jgi:Flp pilus assembly protein TadB
MLLLSTQVMEMEYLLHIPCMYVCIGLNQFHFLGGCRVPYKSKNKNKESKKQNKESKKQNKETKTKIESKKQNKTNKQRIKTKNRKQDTKQTTKETKIESKKMVSADQLVKLLMTVFVPLVFGIIVCVGAFGNVLVITVVATNQVE